MFETPFPTDDAERSEDLRRLGMLLTAPEEELDRVTRELANIFDVPGAYISFIDEDTQYYKSEYGGLPKPFAASRTEPREGSLCAYVVGINDELVVEDLQSDERFCDCEPVTEFGIRFYAGTPLRADSGRAVGSLCIIDTKPREMTPREREMLRLVAEGTMATVKLQVASRQLMQRSHQIENDLSQAVRAQRFLLPPRMIEKDGWRIEHLYRPVEHLGGDFVDVCERPDGRWALIVADVSGHGASAALTTAMAKTAFRRAATWVGTPAQLLDSMHREMLDFVPPEQFLTATAALFAPAARHISFASAGHPQPLRVRQDAPHVEVIEHDNELPLCIDGTASYHAQTDITLAPGERFLIYTDGAVEVHDPAGRLLGAQRFKELLATAARDPQSDRILEAIFAQLQTYCHSTFGDDVALLCVEV